MFVLFPALNIVESLIIVCLKFGCFHDKDILDGT